MYYIYSRMYIYISILFCDGVYIRVFVCVCMFVGMLVLVYVVSIYVCVYFSLCVYFCVCMISVPMCCLLIYHLFPLMCVCLYMCQNV